MKQKSEKTCGYCGEKTTDWTRDHVVPSLLWGGKGNLPRHPVIVPACEDCRLLYDKDAEYFRNRLLSMMKAGLHPVADRLKATTVKRSCQRSPSVSADVTRDLRFVPVVNDNGIVVGTGIQSEVDIPRFSRIAEKIIRGIYFHKSGKAFPATHEIRIFPPKAFAGMPGYESLVSSMTRGEHQGDDVFYCRYVRDISDPDTSVWLLIFYDELGFFAVATPIGQPDVAGLVAKCLTATRRSAVLYP